MTTLDQQWADLYASGRVRWMAGMRTPDNLTVVSVYDDGDVYVWDDSAQLIEDALYRIPPSVSVPDWSDPATIGCLLHQAREVWDDAGLTIMAIYVPGTKTSYMWHVRGGHYHGSTFRNMAEIGHGAEPAAILAAIAAAPPRSTK